MRRPRRRFRSIGLVIRLGRYRLGAVIALAASMALLAGVSLWLQMSVDASSDQARAAVAAEFRHHRVAVSPGDDGGPVSADALEVVNGEALVTVEDRAAVGERTIVTGEAVQTDPKSARFGLLLEGRHPTVTGEVTVSEALADQLGLRLGDRLALIEPGTGDQLAGGGTVVGIHVNPVQPSRPIVAGVVDQLDAPATVYLTDTEDLDGLTGASVGVTSARFVGELEIERLGQGPLGVASRVAIALALLAAVAFLVAYRAWRDLTASERKALTLSGMSDRRADAVVRMTAVLAVLAGVAAGTTGVFVALHLAPEAASAVWGMRWVTGPSYPILAAGSFLVLVSAIGLGGHRLADRIIHSQATGPVKRPFSGRTRVVTAAALVGAVGFYAFPRTRETYDTNVRLAVAAALLVMAALPTFFAAVSGSTVSPLAAATSSRRRRRYGLLVGAGMAAVLVGFLSSYAANAIDEQRHHYQPFSPIDSFAVRELSSEAQTRAIASAVPLPAMTFRSLDGGVVAVPPSQADCFLASDGYQNTVVEQCEGGFSGAQAEVVVSGPVWTDTTADVTADTVLAAPAVVEEGLVALFRYDDDGRIRAVGTSPAEPYDRLERGLDFAVAIVAPETVAAMPDLGQPTRFYYYAGFGVAELDADERSRAVAVVTGQAPQAAFDIEDGYRDGGSYLMTQLLAAIAAVGIATLLWTVEAQFRSEERELWYLAERIGIDRRAMLALWWRLRGPLVIGLPVAALAGWRTAGEIGAAGGVSSGSTPWIFVVVTAGLAILLAINEVPRLRRPGPRSGRPGGRSVTGQPAEAPDGERAVAGMANSS